jgi:hypothetical protein
MSSNQMFMLSKVTSQCYLYVSAEYSEMLFSHVEHVCLDLFTKGIRGPSYGCLHINFTI